MPYLSLYRKYRPQTFAQVMGQDHVVQTLQNALKLAHVANGYLFCGTRGVAKTTIARILAKCLNCIGTDGTFTSAQGEPCNACEFCKSIQAGQCVDVVEMDAASNRSVNDMAKLRESVQFGPMETRYKVYIVDEAHQLSSDAKDAFLKTLEEPPANVVFILATTEAHAIPITIASRCQQFDFRRGSVTQIAAQCARVLQDEGVAIPEDALALIARGAEGSYRDALSLLDQVLAYKRDGITAADVAIALGTVESEVTDQILQSVAENDQNALFEQADTIFLHGKDVRQLLKAVAARLRDILYVRAGGSSANATESAADSESLKRAAQLFTPETTLRLLELVTNAERQTRLSDQHRLLLEMTFLKLAMTAHAPQPAANSEPVRTQSTAPRPSRPAAAPARTQAEELPAPAEKIQPPPIPEIISEPLPPIPVSAAPRDDDATLIRLQASWEEVIHHMQVRSSAGVQVVKDAVPLSIDGAIVTLGFNSKAMMGMLEKPKRRELIEQLINKIMRVPEGTFRVRPVMAADEAPAPPTVPPITEPQSRGRETSDERPVLDEVIAVFGGRIIDDEREM